MKKVNIQNKIESPLVIDNLIDERSFSNIQNTIFNPESFPWFINHSITGNSEDKEYYLTHMLYVDYKPNSPMFDLFLPVIEKINPLAIIRVKANWYPPTDKIVEHQYHQDRNFDHCGAVFYLNTNNGKTIFDDGTEIKSVENRLLLFNPYQPHKSTTCSDNSMGRYNINMNFLGLSDLP